MNSYYATEFMYESMIMKNIVKSYEYVRIHIYEFILNSCH